MEKVNGDFVKKQQLSVVTSIIPNLQLHEVKLNERKLFNQIVANDLF